MWVFGYGSLMGGGWEAELGCIRRVPADLQGYKRVFNKASVRNWGTKANPCPTLNIVKNPTSTCRGIAFQFGDDKAKQVRAYLVEREGKSFALHTLQIRFDNGGKGDAIVPIYAGKNIMPEVDLPSLKQKILAAKGTDGSGTEYVQRVARELQSAGIDDPIVSEIAALIGQR